MSNDNLVQILILVAIVIFFLICLLTITLIAIKVKEKKRIRELKQKEEETPKVQKPQVVYTPESILDFMEFEKIEDNMIIQKNGKFLMVIECKGLNYDLMSEAEKISVEQGFIGFLNTLRHPVQIYIQTRTINLERSIDGYKSRLRVIQKKYEDINNQYEKMLNDSKSSAEQVDKMKYEVVKQKNLKEYTEDIIRDIEKQSLNRNILSKKYYVIIPCYQSEIESGEFDKKEIKNMAFDELCTRARAVINSLFSCQVTGRVLNSEELVDLLYMAYNRDEADLFWMEKLKKAGFDELYSTAPDVTEKKLKLLNKEIESEAIEKANRKISEAKTEKEVELLEIQKHRKQIVDKKAKELISKNKKFIGTDLAEKAIRKIGENSEEEDKEDFEDGQKQEKATKRGRPKKAS